MLYVCTKFPLARTLLIWSISEDEDLPLEDVAPSEIGRAVRDAITAVVQWCAMYENSGAASLNLMVFGFKLTWFATTMSELLLVEHKNGRMERAHALLLMTPA